MALPALQFPFPVCCPCAILEIRYVYARRFCTNLPSLTPKRRQMRLSAHQIIHPVTIAHHPSPLPLTSLLFSLFAIKPNNDRLPSNFLFDGRGKLDEWSTSIRLARVNRSVGLLVVQYDGEDYSNNGSSNRLTTQYGVR